MTDNAPSRGDLAIFLALTYGISWLFWVPTAIFGGRPTESLWVIPFLLGGFGPSVAGVIMVYRRRDRVGRRRFWRRVVDGKRISPGWYAFILLLPPALYVISLLVNGFLMNEPPALPTLEQIAANPLSLVGLLIIGVLAGPLSEELGWRGFAQDRLQARMSPLVSSLVVATFWWAWHLPLFFMAGTTQSEWGVFTPSFWLFMAGTAPLSVLHGLVYNRNDRSILAAILLHFAYNFTLSLVGPLSPQLFAVETVLLFVTTVGVVVVVGEAGAR